MLLSQVTVNCCYILACSSCVGICVAGSVMRQDCGTELPLGTVISSTRQAAMMRARSQFEVLLWKQVISEQETCSITNMTTLLANIHIYLCVHTCFTVSSCESSIADTIKVNTFSSIAFLFSHAGICILFIPGYNKEKPALDKCILFILVKQAVTTSLHVSWRAEALDKPQGTSHQESWLVYVTPVTVLPGCNRCLNALLS